MVTKADLRKIVDELDETAVIAAGRILERLRGDPVLAAVEAAPYADEPLTDEDIEAIERAREDRAAGRSYTLEEVRAELNR